MTETITAIVENGMLRPEKPLTLEDGTAVQLVILPARKAPPSMDKVREAIARIAELPMEEGPEFSGRDHDKILYGEDGAR